ncbi:MAG: hypothetical protein IJ662_02230 [Clostridia bacterium]|nr:hypothetical protein [Clostridia bacterium]
MKKAVLTLLALGLTAALAALYPRLMAAPAQEEGRAAVVRVWIGEKEPAVLRWAGKRAAAYEKETGRRLYLRAASEQEIASALAGEAGAVIPDLLIGPAGDQWVALRGYALILRDDAHQMATPAPTAALFFRPSPTPGPAAAPPSLPDWADIGAVLAPEELLHAVPGAVLSADPGRELSEGRARAALLSAGQAAQLTVGFRAFAVPEGRGLLPVCARGFSDDGAAFLSFLLSNASQTALADHGLYAVEKCLYSIDDPVRYWIDQSRAE